MNTLTWTIRGRNQSGQAVDDLRRGLSSVKGALAGVEDYAKRASRQMRNIGLGLSAAVTGPIALLSKQSVGLYDQQVKAEAAVTQAIASTGSAAKLTSEQLFGMASALQAVTVFGDEEILRDVSAPLLTFTKIQEDTFGRAQMAVLDLATLMKTDLSSAALQVGKALNDPVQGVSALGRAGVQFSDDQREMIGALVETNRLAEAQAIILKELETQFGGQAVAAANSPLGRVDQLQNSIGDLKEELGSAGAPFLKPLVDSLQEGVAWFGELDDGVKRNIVTFAGVAAAVGPVLAGLGLVGLGVTSIITAGAALGSVAAVVFSPVGALIGGLALVGAAAWSASDALKDTFDAASRGESLNIAGTFGVLQSGVESVAALMRGDFKVAWSEAAQAVTGALDIVSGVLGGLVLTINGVGLAASGALTGDFTMAISGVRNALDGLNAVAEAVLGTNFVNFVGKAGDALTGTLSQALDGILTRLENIGGAIKDILVDWNIFREFPEGSLGPTDRRGRPLGLDGARADGGPVTGGGRYLVGERGPELFVPQTDGTIIPNEMLGGVASSIKSASGVLGSSWAGLFSAMEGRATSALKAVRAEFGALELDGAAAVDNVDGSFERVKAQIDAMDQSVGRLLTGLVTRTTTLGGAINSMLSNMGNSLLNTGFSALVGATGLSAIAAPLFQFGVGAAFQSGEPVRFAQGSAFTNSVVSQPTRFAMGEMGEDGPEAIMPLTRARDGSLGVRAVGGSSDQDQRVILHVYTEPGVVAELVESTVSAALETYGAADAETFGARWRAADSDPKRV